MLFQEVLSSLDIHLLSTGFYQGGKEWDFQDVNSYYNRLLFVLEGEVTVAHHSRKYRVQAGEIHLIPCYTTTDYICESEEFSLFYIHFTSRAFGGLDICVLQEYDYQRNARSVDRLFFKELARLNPQRIVPIADPATQLYRSFHERTQEEYHQEISPRLHMENQAYIALILAPFLETALTSRSTRVERRRMYDFASYVEAHLSQPMTVREIAENLGVTPNYLSDWLYRVLKIRPIDYINQRRIEEAQLLLISTERPINEIAAQVGFASPGYFARVFRKQLKMTAARYRKLHK
jgi:AraC-like DNA-binding protein